MKKALILLLVIFSISSIAFSAIVESGDNGKQFAADTSTMKCQEMQTKAVYICKGNVVKVVAQDGLNTFYKPDGRVITCRDGASPAQMGAECVQLLMPNICPTQSVCGASTSTPFPGANTSSTTINTNGTVVTTTPDPVEITTPQTQQPETNNQSTNQQPTQNNEEQNTNEDIVTTYPTRSLDAAPDNLTFIIIGLGLASLVVLFFMFRKTLSE